MFHVLNKPQYNELLYEEVPYLKKILLAIGSEAAEARLKQNAVLAPKYQFTSVATHKESIISIAKNESADIILLRESLPGTTDTMSLIFTIRSELPKTRIIFMTSSRPAGDPLMSSLVSCGVYDILATSSFSINSIVDIIENPKTFADVSSYIIGKGMNTVNELKETVPAHKSTNENDEIIKRTPAHKTSETSVENIKASKPNIEKQTGNTNEIKKDYGKLKIDGDDGGVLGYSPILEVNKSQFSKSFKPNLSKPDVSTVEDIIFDDEQIESVEQTVEAVHDETSLNSDEDKVSKPDEENVPLNESINEPIQEENIIPIYERPKNNSFITGHRDLSKKNRTDIKNKPVKVSDSSETLNEIKDDLKLNSELNLETKPVEVHEYNKSWFEKDDNIPYISTIPRDDREHKENKENSTQEIKHEEKTSENIKKFERKEDDAPKNDKTWKINMEKEKVYTFIRDDIFSMDHSPLNVAIILAKHGGKILFITLHQNGVLHVNDYILESTWMQNYENIDFYTETPYTLFNRVNKRDNYTHVIIDTYTNSDMDGIFNQISDKVIHVIRQSPLSIDSLKKEKTIRKDIAIIPEYCSGILSYKTIAKEQFFSEVVRIMNTEEENYNAIMTKLPIMARKNNIKTLKNYEDLMMILEKGEGDE